MAWTTPHDWTSGETVTDTLLDLHLRDNTRYLKGLDGDVTIEDDIILSAGKSLAFGALATSRAVRLDDSADYRIEVGTGTCNTSVTSEGGNVVTTASISFSSAFSDTPKVFISCVSVTSAAPEADQSMMTLQPNTVSASSFTIKARSEGSTMTSFTYYWIAIGPD